MLQISGIVLIILSGIVLMGHLVDDITVSSLGTGTELSPATAICFIIIGVSKLLVASYMKSK